ncbi:hypothetical protein [Geotalea sp. SG265]|uniref:hypothetical protein n=1 Tax=Geotalea sp. SG265 TaxID=2922867 RepID=UPI001FB002B8|nr:hypothetical protein [Geotalea sp. SG265]
MNKIISFVILSIFYMITAIPAHADIILADHFDMNQDWSGSTGPATQGITSTDKRGNAWSSMGVNFPVVIDQASRFGTAGRGLRFQVAPGDGNTTIGAEMTSYPQKPWQGRTQFIGYRSKISDNGNWGTNSKVLKMLRFNMENNDVIPELLGGSYSVFIGTKNAFSDIYKPDNNWHKYLWEFDAQSSPITADGIIRLWVDDVLVYENTSVQWTAYGNIKNGTLFQYGNIDPYGWNFAYIQGNLSGDYNGPVKYLYWDDYIVATTKAEVDSFLGTGSVPTAPAA